MNYLEIIEAPESYPVTLNELKAHLRLDVTEDAFTVAQTIVPASHSTAASYSLEGSAVDVSTSTATVVVNAGSCGAAGTVAVKIQESLTGSSGWTDVTDGSFTTITTANDNATYQIDYAGELPFIRAVATVTANACSFSVDVQLASLQSVEDALLTSFIATATLEAEEHQSRKIIEQTVRLNADYWQACGMDLMVRPVQEIDEITYLDTNNVRQTLDSAEYELVNGVVYPAHGSTFPNALCRPGSIHIDFIAGYSSVNNIPEFTRNAILMKAGLLHQSREGSMDQNALNCIRRQLDMGLWKLKGFTS